MDHLPLMKEAALVIDKCTINAIFLKAAGLQI